MVDEILQAKVGELDDNAKITVFACQIRMLYDEIAAQEFALGAIKKENAALRAERDRLVEVADILDRECPPDEWEPNDSFGEPVGYGKRGDPNFVDSVDISNRGDTDRHARAVGRWCVAKALRAAARQAAAGVKEPT